MEIEELRKKTIAELQKLLEDSRKELAELRFKLASKQLKNVRQARESKKNLARILTTLNEKTPQR